MVSPVVGAEQRITRVVDSYIGLFLLHILRVSNAVGARQAWAILVNSGRLVTNTRRTSNNTIGTTFSSRPFCLRVSSDTTSESRRTSGHASKLQARVKAL